MAKRKIFLHRTTVIIFGIIWAIPYNWTCNVAKVALLRRWGGREERCGDEGWRAEFGVLRRSRRVVEKISLITGLRETPALRF